MSYCKTPWLLVRKRTIPTERPWRPVKLMATFSGRGMSLCQYNGFPRPLISVSRPEPLLLFQVAPQLSWRGWVDPVPEPLLPRKSGSAGNRTWDLWYSGSLYLWTGTLTIRPSWSFCNMVEIYGCISSNVFSTCNFMVMGITKYHWRYVGNICYANITEQKKFSL
jgi:hypothetical protein